MLSLFDSGPPPPCPGPFNLAAHVLAGGAATPDKTALQILHPDHDETYSFARLTAAILGCGTGLLALGVAPGDRILLRLGNQPAFPIAFLGAIAAGLIPIPTSPQLTTPEVDRIFAQTRPALIVAGAGIPRPTAPPIRVVTDDTLHAMAALPPCPVAMADPDRLAYMIYTSGSSGHPRAVLHAHRALWARRMMHQGWTGMTARDRMLHAGAFNWTYTLGTGLLDPWSMGATALIPAPGTPPAALGPLLRRAEATIFAASPGLYRQMLKSPLPPLPHLRHGLSAGEKLPDTIRGQWTTATATPVHEALGLSECSTFLSASPARAAPPGTVGYPQQGRHVAILGPDGTPAPIGTPGALAIHRSDSGLFLGYLDAERETNACFQGDWFLTGDTAAMARDHAITYLGRNDDMMNPGGTRVSPLEVEAAMATHAALSDVAATEVTVKPGVTVIACFYVAAEPLPDTALAAHANARLARYKQPRLFIRVPALPRGATNKLSRRTLRHYWETSHGQT